jgi:Carboxypeptidase regulatory-like domain/von Willebrand factor type A domain
MVHMGVSSGDGNGPCGLVSASVFGQVRAAARMFAIASLGLMLAACGGGGGGDSGGGGGGGGGTARGSVTVTVNDGTSPVSGASVSATNDGVTQTGTTAADGTVTLASIPAGTASVTASKTNYDNGTRSVSIVADSTATTTITIARQTGSIAATVTDEFGAPVSNAVISATNEGTTVTRNTTSNGTVSLVGLPTGTVSVSVTATGFNAPAAQNVTVVNNTSVPFTIALQRATQAAGGFVLSRVVGTPTNNGQTVQFRLQLLVIDQDSQAVTNLTPADMTLQNCTPDSTTTGPDCLRNTDAAYTVTAVPAAPDTFKLIQPPLDAPYPYAAAMLLDQSNSIKTSDPTDARIFASKVFMESVGANDRVVLSVFADDSATEPTNVAKIPTPPLHIYGQFTGDGASYFDELDQLASLEGGTTPLYQSLNDMIDYTQAAPAGVANERKAVVLFSDGEDTSAACAGVLEVNCRNNSITNATAAGNEVDIFTIGLSGKVNFEAMAELADRAGGVFLFAESANQLIPIYGALGNLLSDSLAKYEVTWTIQAAAANTFVSGRTILGEVQIRTSSNPVNLPIIVRIP